MTPQEAQIIRSVFDRLKAAEAGPRDAEAEALVEALLKADPQAGLALVRALVLTDRAREAATSDVARLTEEMQALKTSVPQPAATSGGLFGGPWGGQPAPQPPAPPAGPWGGRAPQAGPWDAQPQAQSGGGFWSSALRTGAGVAGGLFAFEAVKSLFGGGSHGYGQTAGLFDQPTTIVNETVNVFQNDPSSAAPSLFDGGDPLQSASWDDGSFDAGGFGGDDDNWA
ncbi:MAG: DUF2076 domain-containing protein [Hyphomicrobiales bacterium]|nr:DUF2076 domain-containing protein [Hyphomicrobiales bacterium]